MKPELTDVSVVGSFYRWGDGQGSVSGSHGASHVPWDPCSMGARTGGRKREGGGGREAPVHRKQLTVSHKHYSTVCIILYY